MNISGGLTMAGRFNLISTAPDAYNVNYLVVAGGGGGGLYGGGGGGGTQFGSTTLLSGTSYAVTVGAGGPSAATGTSFSGIDCNGGDSSIIGTNTFGKLVSTNIVSIGGGSGPTTYAGRGGGGSYNNPSNGGSGGGQSATTGSLPGLGIAGQGNDGGIKGNGGTGGAGGGAGSPGYSAGSGAGLNQLRGGDGIVNSTLGTMRSINSLSIALSASITFATDTILDVSSSSNQPVRIAYDEYNYMDGLVIGYVAGSTPSLTVKIYVIIGSGTYSSWTVNFLYGAGGSQAIGNGVTNPASPGGGSGSPVGSAAGSGVTTFGGGGGACQSTTVAAGSGGSGVVIISYQNATQRAAGGTVSSYISNGLKYWVHKFIASGTYVA